MRPSIFSTALLCTLALASATSSRAQFVVPTGYSYGSTPPSTTGPSGALNIYPDSSGNELTDGVTGLNFTNYVTELDAAVWVGWASVSPTITFQFSTMQTFSRVEVGTNRMDSNGISALSSVTIAGTTFTSGVALVGVTRDWLIFDQNFSTTLISGIPTLTLTLAKSSANPWIMLDEVRFTAIPEPAQTTVLISLAALALLFARRRKLLPRSRDA